MCHQYVKHLQNKQKKRKYIFKWTLRPLGKIKEAETKQNRHNCNQIIVKCKKKLKVLNVFSSRAFC